MAWEGTGAKWDAFLLVKVLCSVKVLPLSARTLPCDLFSSKLYNIISTFRTEDTFLSGMDGASLFFCEENRVRKKVCSVGVAGWGRADKA